MTIQIRPVIVAVHTFWYASRRWRFICFRFLKSRISILRCSTRISISSHGIQIFINILTECRKPLLLFSIEGLYVPLNFSRFIALTTFHHSKFPFSFYINYLYLPDPIQSALESKNKTMLLLFISALCVSRMLA